MKRLALLSALILWLIPMQARTSTVLYTAAVLADHPVGYWKLNEVVGTISLDATGAHNGNYMGSPNLGLAGIVAYSGNLAPGMDGTKDRIKINSMASGISWSKGFTLEIWVRFSQHVVEDGMIGFNNTNGSQNLPGLIRDEPTDRFKYRDGHPGSPSYHYALSKTLPKVGVRYYVVATVTGSGSGKLYVNGVQEAAFTTDRQPPKNGGLFAIGNEYDDGPLADAFLHGRLDEAAVYNYALSATRVKAHWNARG